MASTSLPPSDAILSVSALTQQVRSLLEAAFANVWVSGEISNLSRHSSGHTYLSLKDDKACLRAAIYRGVGIRVRFEPRDGMEVVCRGRISVFAPRGEYQLAIEEIHPKGIGALELALQQLREKLDRKGYFDPRRKKKLPVFPRRIALVTSPTGAAIRDMLETLSKRWPVAAVVVVPVRVQGDGSAAEVAAAIGLLNRLHQQRALCIDAMVVGRGGGSLEDLWAFNEEPVADAIFASKIPVVSAVGHETDVSISDLVADYRALTPSRAITDLTPDRLELSTALCDRYARLRDRMVRRIDMARQHVAVVADRRVFRSPLDRIRELEKRLDDVDGRLGRAACLSVERSRQRMSAIAGRLESLSPLNVLARGYSLTRTPDGHVIQDAGTVHPGDIVVTRLARGGFTSRVQDVRTVPKETT